MKKPNLFMDAPPSARKTCKFMARLACRLLPHPDNHLLHPRLITFAFTLADGFELAVFLHVEMNDAAVEGVERTDLHGVAPATDLVGGFEDFLEDVVALAFAVALAIDDHARGFRVGALENAVQQKLQ